MSSSASRVWTISGSWVSRDAAIWARRALPLPFAVAMVVIIIEAGLLDADHLQVAGLGGEMSSLRVGMEVGLVQVDADRRHDVILALRGADHRIPFAGAGRDVEHQLDADAARRA